MESLAALTLLALPATVADTHAWSEGSWVFPPICASITTEFAELRLEQLEKPVRCMAFMLADALAVLTWPDHPRRHVESARHRRQAMRSQARTLLTNEHGSSDVLFIGRNRVAVVPIERFWDWEDQYSLVGCGGYALDDNDPLARHHGVGAVVKFFPPKAGQFDDRQAGSAGNGEDLWRP